MQLSCLGCDGGVDDPDVGEDCRNLMDLHDLDALVVRTHKK